MNGSCGIVDPAAPTIVASIATCTPDDGATGPLCLSVKGFNAAGDSSSFSNWRCSDTDAFGIDDAVAGYAPGTYAAGRVGFGTSTPVMASTASPTNCIVDLSFLPYRYLCLAGETELETGISGLRSLAEAQERVFWVGEIDDTVVQDFDPPEQPTRAAKAKRAQARNLLEVCMTRLSIGTTMVAR